MPLDHYVSQVHLKQFFSPALGSRLYATKKSDLKFFQCHSKDVCRLEEGSTNAYLINDRAIEEFLRGIEPNYDAAISKLRQRAIDQECVAVVAGFAAYVACCAPAAMRIHTEPLIGILESTANILDRQGVIEKAPASLGSKSLSELLADGTVRHKVDEKYPQAVGISTVMGRMSIWGNSAWEILHNDIADSPFFTSDYPVALEATGGQSANWIVPLAPDLAIRVIPDVSLPERFRILNSGNSGISIERRNDPTSSTSIASSSDARRTWFSIGTIFPGFTSLSTRTGITALRRSPPDCRTVLGS